MSYYRIFTEKVSMTKYVMTLSMTHDIVDIFGHRQIFTESGQTNKVSCIALECTQAADESTKQTPELGWL